MAAEAGVSRGSIARIEQGHAASVTVETLEKVARPLGARVICRLTWQGEGLDRLLDAEHAAIVEGVDRRPRLPPGQAHAVGCRGQVRGAGRPGDTHVPRSQGTARPGDRSGARL